MTIATPVENSYRLMAVRSLVIALMDAEDNAQDAYSSEGWIEGRANAPQDIAVIQIVQEVTLGGSVPLSPPAGGFIHAAFFAIYTDGIWADGLNRAQFAQHLPEALEKFFSIDCPTWLAANSCND